MLIHQGRVIRLYKQKVPLPGKKSVELDIIKHPGAVLIVPFLAKNKIILLRQYRPVLKQYIYEFPAGTIDKGETPLECARREIAEETGFCAKNWKLLGYIYPVPGYSTEKIYIYKATGLKKHVVTGDSDEIIETMVVSRQQIVNFFKKGRLVDAKTISALVFCGLL